MKGGGGGCAIHQVLGDSLLKPKKYARENTVNLVKIVEKLTNII